MTSQEKENGAQAARNLVWPSVAVAFNAAIDHGSDEDANAKIS
jgi:hypothetical protein